MFKSSPPLNWDADKYRIQNTGNFTIPNININKMPRFFVNFISLFCRLFLKRVLPSQIVMGLAPKLCIF